MRCPQCGEQNADAAKTCSTCGKSLVRDTLNVEFDHEAFLSRALGALTEYRDRYGVWAVASLIGLLPAFPLGAVFGIGCGGFALWKISRGEAPRPGLPLAIIGLSGAVLWAIAFYSLAGYAEDRVWDIFDWLRFGPPERSDVQSI